MNPLEKFTYCPVCGSRHFEQADFKSKLCSNCGFHYFLNPAAATAAFIFNPSKELLVLTRKGEPAKGTLDLPGGFCDMGETLEEGVRREVKEETGLEVKTAEYLFSVPNKYRFSGIDIPTTDAFFRCEVDDLSTLHPMDDAAEAQWLPLSEIKTELFGLRSIRHALHRFLEEEEKK